MNTDNDLVTVKRHILRGYVSDYVWSAYNAGIERNGKWQDGCLSDAEFLTTSLNLSDGWNDARKVRAALPDLIERLMDEVIIVK